MKLILFQIVFLTSVLPVLLIGQTSECDLPKTVFEIKKAGYLMTSEYATGLTSEPYKKDSQFIRFKDMTRCASSMQLLELMENPNNYISLYSWLGYLQNNPGLALQYLMKRNDLKTRRVCHFLNLCQGSVDVDMSFVMTNILWQGILNREIELSATEIVDFLNYQEEGRQERMREYRHPNVMDDDF